MLIRQWWPKHICFILAHGRQMVYHLSLGLTCERYGLRPMTALRSVIAKYEAPHGDDIAQLSIKRPAYGVG